jgi:preprotein translocase subunit YajC
MKESDEVQNGKTTYFWLFLVFLFILFYVMELKMKKMAQKEAAIAKNK